MRRHPTAPNLMGGMTMATFENRATLSYNGRTTDSNVVTGEIL